MKKKKNEPKLIRTSATPPPGWPTEEEWAEIEKEMKQSLASNVLPEDAGPIDRTKADICSHFVRFLRHNKITQRELAKKLNISESRVSEIVHYHFERYTIDKLLELLSIIKPDVKIDVA